MVLARTGPRNREILLHLLDGVSKADLAERHGISLERLDAVIRQERAKIELSPELEYRALRLILANR